MKECVGLDHKPTTVLDHIECHVIYVRTIISAKRRSRQVSTSDITKARDAAEEALHLMTEDPKLAQQLPGVEEMLRHFLGSTPSTLPATA